MNEAIFPLFPSVLGQKWQCVEDTTGKLRLFKCKNDGGVNRKVQRGAAGHQWPLSIKSQLYQRSNSCNCDLQNLRPLSRHPSLMKPFNNKPFFSRKSECAVSLVERS